MEHGHYPFNFFKIKKVLGWNRLFYLILYKLKIKGGVHAPSACAQHKNIPCLTWTFTHITISHENLYQTVSIVDFLGWHYDWYSYRYSLRKFNKSYKLYVFLVLWKLGFITGFIYSDFGADALPFFMILAVKRKWIENKWFVAWCYLLILIIKGLEQTFWFSCANIHHATFVSMCIYS